MQLFIFSIFTFSFPQNTIYHISKETKCWKPEVLSDLSFLLLIKSLNSTWSTLLLRLLRGRRMEGLWVELFGVSSATTWLPFQLASISTESRRLMKWQSGLKKSENTIRPKGRRDFEAFSRLKMWFPVICAQCWPRAMEYKRFKASIPFQGETGWRTHHAERRHTQTRMRGGTARTPVLSHAFRFHRSREM